jgi:hypothetical protein
MTDMTPEGRAKYGRTRTIYEFMSDVAFALEASGGLNQDLSDRIEEIVVPIRTARDLMRHAGEMMVRSKPLPGHFDEVLDIMQDRALEAMPKLKALVAEACDDLILSVNSNGRDAGRSRAVATNESTRAQA